MKVDICRVLYRALYFFSNVLFLKKGRTINVLQIPIQEFSVKSFHFN